MDSTFTIVPGAWRATRSATTACMRKNGALRLTAMCASNSSGVVSSRVPRLVSPAALTTLSTRPNPATAAARPGPGRGRRPAGPGRIGLADVGLDEQRLGPRGRQFGGQRLARLAPPAGD